MTIFTQPLTGAVEKLNHLADHPTLQQNLDKAREALTAAALKDGLSTPFTEGGDIRTELSETELAGTFRQAEALFTEADRDRNAMLKTAAITAGSIAGATIGGLALREAHRRGWIAGALRAINKSMVPQVIARRHGKLAGAAARLAMDDKIRAVVDELNADADVWEGRVRLSNDGFVLYSRDKDERITVPFDAVTGINQALDEEGRVKHATLTISDSVYTECAGTTDATE